MSDSDTVVELEVKYVAKKKTKQRMSHPIYHGAESLGPKVRWKPKLILKALPASFHNRNESKRVSVKMLATVDRIMALVAKRESPPNLTVRITAKTAVGVLA